MGIESGPSGRFEGPLTEYIQIEGKVASTFTEVDFDQATHTQLPAQISWPSARFSFQQVRRYMMPERLGMPTSIPVYEGQLEYESKKGKLITANLSLTTSKEKPVYFTGTTNGFYAHDPLMGGRDFQFYIVGLHLNELQENMTRMSATYHELGHVALFHTDADISLFRAALTKDAQDLPPIANAERYAEELWQALLYDISPKTTQINRHTLWQMKGGSKPINKVISLFHERNAWAAGINLSRENGYPTGFEKPSSYFEYARFCLNTYADHFHDIRFVNGFREIRHAT